MLKKLMSISGQAVADQKAFTWQNLIPKAANYHRHLWQLKSTGPVSLPGILTEQKSMQWPASMVVLAWQDFMLRKTVL